MKRRLKVTIEARANGSRRLRWAIPGGSRISRNLGRVTLKQAEVKRNKLERALNSGKMVTAGDPSIGNLLKILEKLYAPEKSEHTWSSMKNALELLSLNCSNRLDRITELDADEFKVWLLETRKRSTVKNILDSLRTAFNLAIRWELITENVFNTVPAPRVPKNTPVVWEPEEIKELLERVPRDLDRCMIYLALDAGFRAKEIANFNILEDYDPETGAVHARNRDTTIIKNTREREVGILPQHKAEMNRLQKKSRRQRMAYPFYCRSNRRVSQRFYQVKVKLGLTKTLHQLRHTCASIMAISASSREVQEYIGDRSIKVVEDHYFGKIRATRLRELRAKADREYNIKESI